MKAVVMYESMFGNSELVARAVADGLAEHLEVEIHDVSDPTAAGVPAGTELLVVGGPTHAFSMSRANTRQDAIRQGAMNGLASRGLREWLGDMPDDLQALPCATFDTRVSRARKLPGPAARSAARMLRRHRAHLVVPPMSFFVDDVAGPLGGDQLTRARTWGAQLAATLLADGDHAAAR
jgi:hypothetical protein